MSQCVSVAMYNYSYEYPASITYVRVEAQTYPKDNACTQTACHQVCDTTFES